MDSGEAALASDWTRGDQRWLSGRDRGYYTSQQQRHSSSQARSSRRRQVCKGRGRISTC